MINAVPLRLQDANAYVEHYHRHHQPVVRDKYRVGAAIDGVLHGVVQVGRPKARMLDDGETVQRGDKISQLVILPCLRPDLEVVDKLDETERGNDGFGSTGPHANMRDEYVRGFIRCKDCEYCIQIHNQYDPLDIKFGCIKGRRDKTDELFDDLGCIEGYLAFGRKEK